MADFELIGGNTDTVLLLVPQNDEARQFLGEVAPEDALWYGNGLAIEPTYVMDFCVNLMKSGYDIVHNGEIARIPEEA